MAYSYNSDGTLNLSEDKQTENNKNLLIKKSYEYTSTNNGVNQSEQVSKIKYEGTYNKEIEYTYDDNGNIVNDGQYQYKYDSQNRLVRDYEPSKGMIIYYKYDNTGDLSKISYLDIYKLKYVQIDQMSYNDNHQLTAVNGNEITYDALGNPLTYYNGSQFTWQMGRQLASATLSDGTQISYKYNADGIRTEKKVGNTTTTYTLIGSKITGQSDGTNTFYFRYDDSDNLVGFELNGSQYFYLTNLVGDIITILDNTGSAVVEYSYSSWGKCTVVTDNSNCNLGTLNPFRYRGYYYDEDTSLYYLQSRYYDPAICKFINIDDPAILLVDTYNPQITHLYDYCNNNPVVYVDNNGYKWITKLKEYKPATPASRNQYKIIENNYSKNKALFKKYKYTYIYGQSTQYIGSMKYGNNYISNVGCEIVATYNIMAMLGKKQNFAQIILEFELNNMYYIVNSGKYGTDPEKIYKYFDAHGVKYNTYKKQSKFCDKMGSGKNHCGIVAFWNNTKSAHPLDFFSGGLHTVAYKYNTKNKKYYFYNLGNSDQNTQQKSQKQFKSYLDDRRFIIGYTF